MSNLETHDAEQASITETAWEAAHPHSDTRADLMAHPEFADLATDGDGNPCVFMNHYSCRTCTSEQVDWSDTWSCACDDECPNCGAPCAPEISDWIGPANIEAMALWGSLPEAGATAWEASE